MTQCSILGKNSAGPKSYQKFKEIRGHSGTFEDIQGCGDIRGHPDTFGEILGINLFES